MYTMLLCVGMLANSCTGYTEIKYPTYEECNQEKMSMTRTFRESNGWAICKNTELNPPKPRKSARNVVPKDDGIDCSRFRSFFFDGKRGEKWEKKCGNTT